MVQDRQLHISRSCPDIAEGGSDVDLRQGRLRFRATGREVGIQVIGSEADGTWMWAHHVESFPDSLVQMVMQLDAIGEKYGERAFQVAGFSLPRWQPGELLSGMSCAAIVAGLGDAAGIYCSYDRQTDRRLWIAMTDENLLEASPPQPLERIVVRFPRVLALAGQHPHQGGLTLNNWVLALDGYCRSLGVNGSMDGDDLILQSHGKQVRASFTDSGFSTTYEV